MSLRPQVRKTPNGVWLVVGECYMPHTVIPASFANRVVVWLEKVAMRSLAPCLSSRALAKVAARFGAPYVLFEQRAALIRMFAWLRSCTRGLRIEKNSDLYCLDIHLDADDPNFVFLSAQDVVGMAPEWIQTASQELRLRTKFRGSRAVVAAYNAPFRRENRLRIRRATTADSIEALMEPQWEAQLLVEKWRREKSV